MSAVRRLALAAVLVGALSGASAGQTVSELYGQGVEARLAGNNELAIDLFNRALVLDPANADVIVQRGFAELGANALMAANASFADALRTAPGYADATYGLALTRYRQGEMAEAAKLIDPLADAYPEREDFADLRARTAIALQTLEVDPLPARATSTAALMRQGHDQRLSGSPAAAVAKYREVLAADTGNVDALVGAGLASGSLPDFAASATYLDRALALDPGNLDARIARARLSIWREDLVDARSRVDAIRRDTPDDIDGLLLDARIRMLEGRLRAAAALFGQAAARAPGNAEAALGLGDVRRLQGREQAARSAYEKALSIEPGSAEIIARLEAPVSTRWRLDLETDRSDLTGDLQDWHESIVSLSFQPRPDTWLTGRLRMVERYGLIDRQVQLRFDRRLGDASTAFATIAATPEADVLARLSLGAGVAWRGPDLAGIAGEYALYVDALWEDFEDSQIATIRPAIEFWPIEDRLRVVASVSHARDDSATTGTGVTLRADAYLSDRLAFLAGLSNAPEISEGSVVESRAVFGGVSYELSERFALTGSYAREDREAFDRDTIAIAVTARF